MSRFDWWAVSDEVVHQVYCIEQNTIEAIAEKKLILKNKTSYCGDMVESGNGS